MAKTNIRGAQIADGANGVDLTVDVTGTLPAANGGTGVTSIGALKTALSLTKSDVGLGNVDNTSDSSKPVSTAQQTALDLKRNITDDDTVFGGNVTTSSALNSLLTTAAASNKVVQLVPGQSIAVTTTVQIPEGTGLYCKTVPRWQHGASATSRPRLIAQTGFTGVVVDVATGSRGIILSGFEIDGASVSGVTHGLRFNASGSDVENSHYIGDVAVRRVVGVGIAGRLRTSLLESIYVFECGTGIDIGGSDGSWFDVHWIGGYVALCKNYGVRIRPNGSGVSPGFLQFINVRVERTGQIANDPKNDGSSANWVNTAPGWDITGAVLCAWTNCTTDANNGPGVQITAPAASEGYKVANLLFTACIFSRDGQNSGTAASSTATAVSVAGLSSSGVDHIGPVRFENCVTMVGESADDGSSTYEAPAYGVTYDHVDFFGWTGTARGTTASHLAGSDLWQPRVDDPFAQINRTVSLAVTGGSPGSGKVLTSDASGNATWQNNGANPLVFSPVSAPTYAAGKLVYDSDNESLTFFNNDSSVSMQVGQEEWIRVRNVTGSTIANGVPVYLSGVSAGLPTIAPAQANAAATTICIGLTTESIPNNTNGFVTCLGVVRGLNTASFTAGQTLFLSAASPGVLTATAPVSPNYRYRVGFVVASNASTGSIHVTPSTAALGNGSANQLSGIASGGTQEYKTVQGTANDLTVTHGAGTITLATGSNVPKVTGGTAATGKAVIRDSGGTNSWLYIPWESEIYLNSTPIAASYTGYSDNDGGVIIGASRGVLLEQVVWRLSNPSAVIGGSGNFQIQWYLGSSTAQETTLIQTTQIAAGQHDVTVTFGTAQTCTVNTVLRAKITSGTATLPSKSSVQWRGSYL